MIDDIAYDLIDRLTPIGGDCLDCLSEGGQNLDNDSGPWHLCCSSHWKNPATGRARFVIAQVRANTCAVNHSENTGWICPARRAGRFGGEASNSGIIIPSLTRTLGFGAGIAS
jgi:hypothetical protein